MSESTQLPDSPYKGLVSYLEEDADFFFGRERERDIITAKLLASRLTLLYGPTGVGKTSILRAGVEHHLRELARVNQAQFGQPEFVVVVFSFWRDDPLVGLLRRIRHCIARALSDPEIDERELDSTLTDAIPKWSKLIGGDLLIVLDQFEDYFLYHENETGDRTFFDEFHKVVNRPDLRASFLISIREDAIAKLDSFKIRIPHIFDSFQRVKHLTTDAARSAIRGPIGVYNQRLQGEEEYTIEDELVDEVCDQLKTGTVAMGGSGKGTVLDLESSASTEEIETPYLQLVMTRLWREEKRQRSRRLQLVTLVKLGNAERIVETHLDDKMESLAPDQQRIASQIFANLVTPSGNKIAHTAKDLAHFSGLSTDWLVPVLEELSSQNSRILRTVPSTLGSSREPRYEIFHDILATPVLDWRQRYNQEQERVRLEEVAKLKQEKDKTRLEIETRRKLKARYRKTALFLLSITTLLMISLAIYAILKRTAAVLALERAEYERANAELTLVRLNELDRSVPYFLTIMRGHNAKVNSVDFNPDAKLIVTSSSDNTARIWSVDSGQNLRVWYDHKGAVNKALFSPDGNLVATVSDDHTAKLWDVVGGHELRTLAGHTGPVKDVAFSRDGLRLATASDDGTARIWEVTTGQSSATLSQHAGKVKTVGFSPSGQSVVTGSSDKTARTWRTADGSQLNILTGHPGELEGHLGEINSVSFSPNNQYVVTASNDGTARLYDAGDGRLLAETKGHTDNVNTASFSPSGKLIVTSSDDQTAKVWEVPSLKLVADFSGHTDKVMVALFSSDGSRVITGSADRTARLWDVFSSKNVSGGTARSMMGFRGHIGTISSVAFTDKRAIAATGSEDNTARIWNTTAGGAIQLGGLSLKAEPDRYSGPCPVAIAFTGQITVNSGVGSVAYRFVRSTGRPGPEKTLSFESPGTKQVSSIWKFGGSRYPRLSGSFYLEVLSPQPKKSDAAHFQVSCDQVHDSPNLNRVETLTPANGLVYPTRPSTIELTWKSVPGETEYTVVVQQYSVKTRTWKAAYILPATGTTATLSVKPSWKRMRWRVSAGIEDTASAWAQFSFKE